MMRKYILIAALGAGSMLLSSCRHKDLYMDDDFSSQLQVVFDWRDAPQANPQSMALYLYESDGTAPLRYIFSNKTGGMIKAPFGTRHAICLNADNTDWAYMRDKDNMHSMSVATGDAESLEGQRINTRSLPQARAAADERVALTPGMLWSNTLHDINIAPHEGVQTITLYPHEAVCHYTVDIYDVENLQGVESATIDGTLSGMAEAYAAEADAGSDTPVTMTFVLHTGTEQNSLHSEFLTFGECGSTEAPHYLTVYMVLSDGSRWWKSFDVTTQVSDAPDPKHVHIVLRGLPLPRPPQPGGGGSSLKPSVDEWQEVDVDLKM